MNTNEERRLDDDAADRADWRAWGTYLPERQWGTVREDYSADGNVWGSFTYEESRLRAYRWGEDGLLGWTDREARLCFSFAFWNGCDNHLKEKLFGLSNSEGNHGEDVKELYYYLDALPSGCYAKALYKYPQSAFPYRDLVEENGRRGVDDPEYELLDTGVLAGNRYFDLTVEYAKRDTNDTLIRLTITNCGSDTAEITVLPTLTLRNVWAWDDPAELPLPPSLMASDDGAAIVAHHDTLGEYRLRPIGPRIDTLLFTGNESNRQALGWGGKAGFTKDAFHRFVVDGDTDAVDLARRGTKAAFLSRISLGPGQSSVLRLRLACPEPNPKELTSAAFDADIAGRIEEADEFYRATLPAGITPAESQVMRQAHAGLLWSKQVYLYDVERWLAGDPTQPPVSPDRETSRNSDWAHLICHDVISMPDKWEYPWFAAWDLAFHAIALAEIDEEFAKSQLLLMLSERYLHPNGAIPAYEFGFSETNPPVHATAAWQIYESERRRTGKGDIGFLEKAFLRLLLHFTWWINRHDPAGKDLFGGGFLGLDNIGLFDRNKPLPDGATLTQADATAWMGMFCSAMMMIAVELAQTRPVFQDLAVKFFHHFLLIIQATNRFGNDGLWDEETGFFYDQVMAKDGTAVPLKVKSIVGLVPLFAIGTIRADQLDGVPEMKREIKAGLYRHPDMMRYVVDAPIPDGPFAGTKFVALAPKEHMVRLLAHMLDEEQFLSIYGIRSVSKAYGEQPFQFSYDEYQFEIGYVPGEGNSGAFGGNSNWRGPIWFPINLLIIHALQRYHSVYGDTLTVECPTGSGHQMTLEDVARELSRRLTSLFLPDASGHRPCHGGEGRYAEDPAWRDLILFNEYFHADTGRGLGASHQTGWTATIATCIAMWHE